MWTLPNVITLVRICFTPVIALLPFIEGYWPKLICFFVFIVAAVSDIWDGHLARRRNEVTDLGQYPALGVLAAHRPRAGDDVVSVLGEAARRRDSGGWGGEAQNDDSEH